MSYTRTNFSAATAAVANRFVTSTNMIVGAYTVANAAPATQQGLFQATVTHTQVGGVTDTLGTIAVTGTDASGATITDTITPLSGTIATGTKWFKTVTAVVGAGWVINTGNDTVVVGYAAGAACFTGPGELFAIVVNTTAAGAVTVSDSAGTIATLKASIAENTYYYEVAVSGYLKISLAAASDITVVHSYQVPTVFATA